jgi:hypothetical protein
MGMLVVILQATVREHRNHTPAGIETAQASSRQQFTLGPFWQRTRFYMSWFRRDIPLMCCSSRSFSVILSVMDDFADHGDTGDQGKRSCNIIILRNSGSRCQHANGHC